MASGDFWVMKQRCVSSLGAGADTHQRPPLMTVPSDTVRGMARDIGPDMLRNLDHQLQAGNIDQAAFEARKAEVMELIRRGRAIDRNPFEIAMKWAVVVAFVIGGFALLGIAGSNGAAAGILLGVALVVLGFVRAGRP